MSENVRNMSKNMSRTCPKSVEKHVPNMSENVRNMSKNMSRTCPKMSEKFLKTYPEHVRKCPKNVRKHAPNMSENVRKPWKNTIKSHFRPCPESNPVPSGSDSGAGSVSQPIGLIPSQDKGSPELSYVSELDKNTHRNNLVAEKAIWVFVRSK